MPSSLFVKQESNSSDSSPSFTSTVAVTSLNRDGSRSAFTPYKPATVLTNLQRGNTQTESPAVLPERSIHQLAGQGELFLRNLCVFGPSFDANQRDENDLTPLMWASGYGQLETVQKLLEHGALVTLIGKSGENALILASSSGHASIVKELINHRAELDYIDQDGNTALMHAVYNNHAACVQELLSAGADFTILNETLDSAFDIAFKKRSKHENQMSNDSKPGCSTAVLDCDISDIAGSLSDVKLNQGNKPVCIIVLGMAGSGKTTFVQRITSYLHSKKESPYVINLDPACHRVPYPANIDIRETMKYKDVMKHYSLGVRSEMNRTE